MFDKVHRVIDPEKSEENEEKMRKDNPEKLEKGDGKAIFLAAMLVFLPLLIVLAGGLILLAWLFFRT